MANILCHSLLLLLLLLDRQVQRRGGKHSGECQHLRFCEKGKSHSLTDLTFRLWLPVIDLSGVTSSEKGSSHSWASASGAFELTGRVSDDGVTALPVPLTTLRTKLQEGTVPTCCSHPPARLCLVCLVHMGFNHLAAWSSGSAGASPCREAGWHS